MRKEQARAKTHIAGKASIWTKLMLVLPLLFIVWSVWLVVSVNQLQANLSGRVAAINRLNELTLSLRELDARLMESRLSGDHRAALARWQAQVGDYRRQAAAVKAYENPLTAESLVALDAASAKMERLLSRALSSSVTDEERDAGENELRVALNRSLDGVGRAIQAIRQELSQHSVELAAKWRQLYLLVFISCLLAIVVAFLLNRLDRDLRRRKAAQDELQKERDFSRAVIETAATLVVVLDREGRIVRFNRACEELTGYSFAEVEGRRFWELFLTPEEKPSVEAVFEKLRAGEFPSENVNHWLTKTGERRLISWTNTALCDDEGQPEYIIGTGLDITERRHTEAALEEGHSVLRAVIEGTPDAIFVKDLEGRYVMANSSAAHFLGKTAEEIIGKTDLELYPPETARQFIADDRRVLTTGETQTFEGEAIGNGIKQMYLVTKAVYRDNAGKVVGLIGISHDITERKRTEEQRLAFVREQQARKDAEEANRIKDEFLTTLSHELRTPLTSILGWTQLLNTEQLDEKMRQRALEVIERNARAQRQLIDDLLDISRVVTGKIRLDARPAILAPIIEAALDAVRPIAANKNVRLHFTAAPGVVWVQGDPVRLQQVFWNLLTNAVKFTPTGGRIEVRLERAGAQARITVKDTGEGISPEFLPFVFDRFRQADSSTTREYGGLGLGLALVHYLVESHGGAVRAESPGEGLGTTFTVNLPTLSEAEPVAAAQLKPVMGTASKSVDEIEGLRVLVVDDDEDSCEIIGLALRKCGADVRLANSAAAALGIMVEWLPDLLLTDIGMPDEDGYALLRKVRESTPEHGGRIPAIALTAYATDTDHDRALAAGFQMHIGKPVELRELTEAIASLAGRTVQSPKSEVQSQKQ